MECMKSTKEYLHKDFQEKKKDKKKILKKS